ncbi:MAG: carboxypeptidase regulatory-like domain-containing protein [Gammaproteobacteria bacterium]|nr:carboxypeptidase regulatory-like domain-containing protein [Gammaproteobacteria bacterium]
MRMTTMNSNQKSKRHPRMPSIPVIVIMLLVYAMSAGVHAYTLEGRFAGWDGAGVSGLSVTAGGSVAVTDSDGKFVMNDVQAMTNSLSVSGAGYKTRSISFPAIGNNNPTVNIGNKYAVAAANGYKIKIKVFDYADSQPLDGVSFTVNGVPVQVESSDYLLSVSEPGSYTLLITKAGYD